MKWLLTLTVGILLWPLPANGQRTLRDMVRERNEPINRIMISDPAPLSFQQLVDASDIIVRGTVASATARLSDDETMIYTDYALTNIQYIVPADAVLAPRPGMGPPPVTVTVRGGVLTLEGHQVQVLYKNLPRLPLGLDGLFFLTQRGRETHVAFDDAGVFEIREGEAVGLGTNRGPPAAVRRRPLDEMLSDIALRGERP